MYFGRLSSTVRRMKAEREQGIPIGRRTGFAVSVETGESASEMNEVAWESFYSGLCDELKRRYPSLFSNIFGACNLPASFDPIATGSMVRRTATPMFGVAVQVYGRLLERFKSVENEKWPDEINPRLQQSGRFPR